MSEIPFSQMNNKDFKNLLYPTNTLQQPPQIIKKSNKEIKDLMTRFKQVNELLYPSENLTSCDYYDINDITKLRINENDLSIIHLNISPVPLHNNELKHPSRNVSTFANDHLKIMLNEIHQENKSTLLTGDFKVNLINYDKKEAHVIFSSYSLATILLCKLHSLLE